jgi:hypothetical protein
MTDYSQLTTLEKFDIGVKLAVKKAILEHKKEGRSIFVSKNGQIIEIPADKIQVPD